MNAFSTPSSLDSPRKTASHIALLIDGDNVPASLYPVALSYAEAMGEVPIRRAYADMNHLPGWSTVPGLRPILSGTGKNSTDLLLTIEAMELALQGKAKRFVIASSDVDFSHLALKLREHGLEVVGIGTVHASTKFSDACTTFHRFPETESSPASPAKVTIEARRPSPLDYVIRGLLKKERGKLMLPDLNLKLRNLVDFKIAETEEKTWRAYLLKRPEFYDVDPKGPEACVRLR